MKVKRERGKFTVVAGRMIYRDGKPFIHIGREGDTSPANADLVCRQIAEYLNGAGADTYVKGSSLPRGGA